MIWRKKELQNKDNIQILYFVQHPDQPATVTEMPLLREREREREREERETDSLGQFKQPEIYLCPTAARYADPYDISSVVF